MLLGKASEPFNDPAWSYELKWDGWRAIVAITTRGVRVWTRHGNDVTSRFPELQTLRGEVASAAVIDGEICVLDDDGYPRFDWIMRRAREATLVAFDVLRAGRRNVIDLPLRERRVLLADIMPSDTAYLLRSRSVADGVSLFRECERRGIEGVIAKRDDSPYRPGVRSSQEWLKIRTSEGNRVIRERLQQSRKASGSR